MLEEGIIEKVEVIEVEDYWHDIDGVRWRRVQARWRKVSRPPDL
jgi:hypothetical protein